MAEEAEDRVEAVLRAFADLIRSGPLEPSSANPLPSLEPLLSTAEAARYLNVSSTTVRALAVGGTIRSTMIGDRRRFRREWLDEWIDEGGGSVPIPDPPASAPVTPPVRRPVRLPARPRRPRATKPPTYIQAIDGLELRLLGEEVGKFPRVYTWHVGEREALCGAVGRWKGATSRGRSGWMCKHCMTMLAFHADANLPAFGIGAVYMMRTSAPGQPRRTIRAGYHTGDGRTTTCGRRQGPWFLTEREPSSEECFVCEHRKRWRNRNLDRSVLVPRPLRPVPLLVDAGPVDPELIALASAHPTAVAARQAVEALPAELWDRWDRIPAAFSNAVPLVEFQGKTAPDFQGPWYIVSPTFGWSSDRVVRQLRDWCPKFERAQALYEKWERAERPASRRRLAKDQRR